MQRIYFDNAATTPVDPRVVEAMLPYFTEKFGNPSSTHSFGQEAHVALNTARQTLAGLLGTTQEHVIFTGGASEAINMTLKGLAHARKERGMHIVASSFEHSTTLAALEQLQKEGWKVTLVTPDKQGFISAETFLAACTPETTLATLLYVQNELGTIQPIAEIGKELCKRDIAFHVDAAQAFGTLDCNVEALHVDTLVLAAHKFYGPKGIGALYIRPGIMIESLVSGSQEFGMRAGTQNVPLAVGMAEAAKLAHTKKETYSNSIRIVKKKAVHDISAAIEGVHFHTPEENVSPHILSVAFEGIGGETLLRRLDLDGIAVSTGAACSSGNGRVSHVLTAIGLPEEIAQATLRISFSHHNTSEEVDKLIKSLAYHVGQIRHMNITY